MIMDIIIPVLAMAALGLIFGAGLAFALKLFGVEADPLVALLITKLPGTNCGACGRAGCAGFAQALRNKDAIPSGCVVSNDQAREEIAKILGIEYNPKVKKVATLLCNGGINARDKYVYNGLKTCRAATLLFGGHKACAFGCLGFGDCVEVCPFDALKMTPQGLPEVDQKKCTACGKCVEICPKKLFVITPIKNRYYVKCNSTDRGTEVARVCKTGCITCGRCEKACPIGAVKVELNLARIYYDKCENIGKCFEVCPTKVIARR